MSVEITGKQKFQIAMLVGVGVLFVAAGLYAIRGRIPFLNRADELKACMPKSVTCDLPYNEEVSGKFKLILKDATGKTIKEGGPYTDPKDAKLVFSYDLSADLSQVNLSRYTCEAVYVHDPSDSIINSELLECNGLVTEQNYCAVIPSPTPKQCQCANGLDCDGGIYEEKYQKGDQPDPGLIRLNPRYTGPQCFACKKIIVTDSEGIKEEYDCSGYPKEANGLLLPTPTVIRLHQAKGSQCMQYSISLVGETNDGKETAPQTCGSCAKGVCCPACVQPTILPDPSGEQSCTSQCSFSFLGFQVACPVAGDSVKTSVPITVAGEYCFSTDKFGGKGKEICKTFSDSQVPTTWTPTIPYPDSGVYDLKLNCPNLLAAPVQIPGEPLPGTGQALPCVQRFSIGCGPNTVTPPGGGTPTATPPTTTPPTSTPTPPSPTPTGMCPWNGSELRVRMTCPNCSQ